MLFTLNECNDTLTKAHSCLLQKQFPKRKDCEPRFTVRKALCELIYTVPEKLFKTIVGEKRNMFVATVAYLWDI